MRISLAPATRCPFGWPRDPPYPTAPAAADDDEPVMTDGTAPSSVPPADTATHGGDWHDELARRYEDTLFAPFDHATRSPVAALAQRMESVAQFEAPSYLINTYCHHLLHEEELASKWRVDVPTLVQAIVDGAPKPSTSLQPFLEDRIEKEVRERMVAVISKGKGKQEAADNSDTQEDAGFTKHALPVKGWADAWAAREAQLQIVLVLETLMLTAPSQPSSPREHEKRKRKQRTTSPINSLRDPRHLERLLEGLVDRLAMWQAISGLDNVLGDIFADDTGGPRENKDMDEVQRFWTDVVEEHYADAMPSFTPSFRPKLFPTSIFEADSGLAGSSLVPTPFRATASIVHAVSRTPNLRALASKAEHHARAADDARMAAHITASPTMAKLMGATREKSLPHQRLVTREASVGVDNTSKRLFGRREFIMSKKPSKARLEFECSTTTTLLPDVTKGGESQNVTGWGGQSRRKMVTKAVEVVAVTGAARRKASSPKKLVFATPRRIQSGGQGHRVVANRASVVESQRLLVPDTPSSMDNRRKKV